MAYYWPQYGIAIEVDDDPHLLPFDEEAFPDTTVYHVTTDVICDHRVVLGARPPHRAYPRHRAPSRLRRARLLAPSDASQLFGADPLHLCARLYRQGCGMSAKKPPPLCRSGASQEAHRCLLRHRLCPCRRRKDTLGSRSASRDGRFGYDGRGQNASGNPR